MFKRFSSVIFFHLMAMAIFFTTGGEVYQAYGQQSVDPSEPAESQDIIVVVVSGVGVDADGAKKNAWSNAVRQAVGSFVSAETLVKNDQVVKDDILTFSNGFITETETLSEGKQPDGLYEITIRAVVQKTQIIEKLKAANVTESDTDTTSPVAERRSKIEKETAAAALLEQALEGLPCSLLEAHLATQEPEVKEYGSKLLATWQVRVSFKQDEYYSVIAPKLRQVFDKIADVRYDGVPGKSFQKPFREGDVRFVWDFQSSFKSSHEMYSRRSVLLLNVGCDAKGTTEHWVWYVLQDSLLGILKKKFRPTFYIHTEFYDDSGSFLGEAKTETNINTDYLYNDDRPRIAPRIMEGTRLEAASGIEFSVKKEFTEENLLKVKKVVCYVAAE